MAGTHEESRDERESRHTLSAKVKVNFLLAEEETMMSCMLRRQFESVEFLPQAKCLCHDTFMLKNGLNFITSVCRFIFEKIQLPSVEKKDGMTFLSLEV